MSSSFLTCPWRLKYHIYIVITYLGSLKSTSGSKSLGFLLMNQRFLPRNDLRISDTFGEVV